MADKAIYLLDSSVFIEAARRYYAFDLAPKFWESLIALAKNDQIQSIDKILQELERGKDELTRWAKENFSFAFASSDEDEISESYSEIMNWVNGESQYSIAAKSEFASGADGWLVAYAIVKDRVVVTHEVSAPEIRRKVPIPNVCQAFGVQFVDLFEMLRKLKVKWT